MPWIYSIAVGKGKPCFFAKATQHNMDDQDNRKVLRNLLNTVVLRMFQFGIKTILDAGVTICMCYLLRLSGHGYKRAESLYNIKIVPHVLKGDGASVLKG